MTAHGLQIVGEATYRRGATATQNFQEQVNILQETTSDAIIIVGAYAAAAVGSEAMLLLLQAASKAQGKDYTVNLITSQVVPSYEDMTIPAVRQYRDMMDRYNPSPPSHLVTTPPHSSQYSFTSFEGFLNAKLLTEILRGVGEPLSRTSLKASVETVRDYDIGVSSIDVLRSRAAPRP